MYLDLEERLILQGLRAQGERVYLRHLIRPCSLCSLWVGVCFGYSLFLWIYIQLLQSGLTCHSPGKWLDKRDRTFILRDGSSVHRNFRAYHLISGSRDHHRVTSSCVTSCQLRVRHLRLCQLWRSNSVDFDSHHVRTTCLRFDSLLC